MTPEEFYIEREWPELDRHDRKAAKFTYYDLLEFAEEYAYICKENRSKMIPKFTAQETERPQTSTIEIAGQVFNLTPSQVAILRKEAQRMQAANFFGATKTF